MFVFGIAVLVLLWAVDLNALTFSIGRLDLMQVHWLQAEWLRSHSYIPNILAGFTGFLIGAPVAAVLLASFALEREEQAAAAGIIRTTEFAWNRFRDAVHELCTDERIRGLKEGPPRARRVHNEVYECFRQYYVQGHNRRKGPPFRWNTTAEEHEQLKVKVTERLPSFKSEVVDYFLELGLMESQFQMPWTEAALSWNTLDQYVRLRRLELGLRWMPQELYVGISRHMIKSAKPLDEFSEMHESKLTSRPLVPSMFAAYAAAKWYMDLDKEALDNRISNPSAKGPDGFFNDDEELALYVQRGIAASEYLKGLRTLIETVDAEGWPLSATELVNPE
ncbi:hypothetical protein [Mycobacterium sp. 852002-10029_SCH5224772]|uniref:hypothetical protein n=1 Tax=Mycobacterium sp. 852002-10029_SCH5224772 TaxID=1834083 RepID=UPI0012E75155|nr:hypothetical protein [Mycobacterium sp. 852002-10029_SCH5224772]